LEHKCISWDGTEIPLKTRNTLSDDEMLHMLYHAENEPDILQEAEKRQNRIRDADYRIQKGKVNERVNIRRLFPYFEDTDH
jgi:hypothetical protein